MKTQKNSYSVKFRKITIFSLLIWLSLPFLAGAQSFTIKGTIKDAKPEARIFLTYLKGIKRMIDTINIDNGQFSFTGNDQPNLPVSVIMSLNQDGKNTIFTPRASKDVLRFFVDAGGTQITVQDSMKHATVVNKFTEELKAYLEQIKVPGAEKFGLSGSSLLIVSNMSISGKEKRDTSAKDKELYSRQEQQKIILDKRKALQKKYILANPNAYTSLMAVMEIGGGEINTPGMSDLFNELSPELRNSVEGKELARRIEDAKKYTGKNMVMEIINEKKAIREAREKALLQVGDQAPDFTMNDTKGKAVKLSDFKGKYVLIDFWASWCVPCRKENPNVVKAYNDFKDKNFTILGVALERAGAAQANWLSAIKLDGLAWTQVSDFNYFNSPVVKAYKVQSIPKNFLIDPTGKIVATNLRGEDLQKKLADLLNN